MTIKYAEVKIREARQRIVALDHELADLRRQSHSAHLSHQIKREMREEAARLRQQRCTAWMELVELVELAEMPPEFMGSA